MTAKTKLPKGLKELGGITLYNYQRESVAFGISKDNAGLLLDMGLGKTIIAITIARYRIKEDKIKKILVVCPPTLMENWKIAVERFSEYKGLVLNVNDREERLARALLKKPHFHIINYESLFPLLRDLGAVQKLRVGKKKKFIFAGEDLVKKKLGYQMIIFDESAKFLRHNTSDRTKCSIILSQYAKNKLILTGTLFNKPMDLWSQFMVLDNGKSFGKNFYAFRNRFFTKQVFGKYKRFKKYKLKKTYVPVFKQKIHQQCIRYTKNEPEVAKELPKIIRYSIELPLVGQFKKIYKEVEKRVIAEIETIEGKSHIEINSIFTKLIRLRQITSGFASEGKGTEKELKHTPKMDALIEEVDTIVDNGESVIVWCFFTKTIDIVESRLKKKGIDSLILDGRVNSNKKKDKIWRKFQTSDIPVFIGQIESGGFGIELFKEESKAKYQHSVFYDDIWNPDVREQAEGRIHRHGQKSICRYVDIRVNDTIDIRMMESRTGKKKVADKILGQGIKKFLKGG